MYFADCVSISNYLRYTTDPESINSKMRRMRRNERKEEEDDGKEEEGKTDSDHEVIVLLVKASVRTYNSYI